jgi:hypothetical protein
MDVVLTLTTILANHFLRSRRGCYLSVLYQPDFLPVEFSLTHLPPASSEVVLTFFAFYTLFQSIFPNLKLFPGEKKSQNFDYFFYDDTDQNFPDHLTRRAAFLSTLKSKVGSTLVKDVTLRITLNIDGAPITSRTHTHPSNSQTSRLLTSSLSLGVPVPRSTQCMRDVWKSQI